MTDKELLYQMMNRSISNALGNINPTFKMFSSTLTKYAINFIDPYVDAFMSPDSGEINTKAAAAYAKEEVNKKIEDFMKKFDSEMKDNGKM